MSTSPRSLSSYQQSARSLAAKTSLPLAAAAAILLPSAAQGGVIATQFSTDNVVNKDETLYINFFDGFVSTSDSSGYTFKIEVGNVQYGSHDHVFSTISSSYGVIAATYFGSELVPARLNGAAAVDSALFSSYYNDRASFNAYSTNVAPGWDPGTGYIGLRFQDGDGYNHYGWLKVSTNADASSITVLAMGYNDVVGAATSSGEGLAPVPEPATSAALLALGAAGLVAYRRRKHLQRAA